VHSTSLRGADFSIRWRGREIPHAEFFAQVQDTERVGIFTPQRFEALGAIALIMAYVTAFYDRYRERGAEFFAYPDFFTFQRRAPSANYGACDIWPPHKNVWVPDGPQPTAEAITDRGVTVLLVPDQGAGEAQLAPVELESARRTIKRCFAYSGSGRVSPAELVVECGNPLLREWALGVLDSVPGDGAEPWREQWSAAGSAPLRQSFRELDWRDALRSL
jgi:hypothetical protein